MSYSDNAKQEIFDALKQFQEEESWRSDLTKWTNRFNIFDVLKISGMEIRHSNMLAWLLDPHETHGWGNSFLKGFLQQFQRSYSWIDENLLQCCDTFTVRREYRNIDILLESEQCHAVIVIENKIYSGIHGTQLKKYPDIIRKKYGNEWNKLFIYLAINLDDIENEDLQDQNGVQLWEPFSHNDILDLIEEIKYNTNDEQVCLLINHYIVTLRRILMRDDELRYFCDEVYNKYKKAIDFIIENKTDNQLILMDKLKKIFNEKAKMENTPANKEKNFLFEKGGATKKYIWFHTRAMNDILKPLDTESSSWNKKCIYKYEIRSDYNKEDSSFTLSAYLVLGGVNVPPREKLLMQKIIMEYNPNDKKKDDFKFKQINDSIKTENIFIDSNEFEKTINGLIDHLLNFERDKLLPLLNRK